MVEGHTWFYTSVMALSIKSDEADRLARQLSAQTGESLTESVVVALRERLERAHTIQPPLGARLRRLQADVAALPVIDRRAPDDILGYDGDGLPT